MEEPLEQEHSMTNDDLKPSSSSTTTTKSSTRSVKQSTNGSTRRHKRRRQTNSTRSSSERSTSSSRSSSSSSTHSSPSSMLNLPNHDGESKKTRSCVAQEQLQTIVEKTKTGKYEVVDSFAFLTFETDEDWKTAFEHFKQQQLQQSYTAKKSYSFTGKKNGTMLDHLDSQGLNRSISMPCKIDDSNRLSHPSSIDDVSLDNHHRSSMWQTCSPNRTSSTTIKTEPTDRSHRRTSEHEENHFDGEHRENSTTSSQKSLEEIKSESNDRKHHHHHHHHHKSHKRHKTNHDLSVNGDSSTKHPTITSMSDLARQHIKHESMPLPPAFHFPPHFDPKLFSLPSYPPFAPPPQPHGFSGSFDPSLMLASRLYGGPYPRDLPMPPPPIPSARPPSRSLQHPFALKENHSEPSNAMEKMFEKLYPGVLPGYLAAAAAAASSSANSNSPVSSLNIKLHGASPNAPDHSLWSQRDALQRQFAAAAAASSTKPSSMKSPFFDSSSKLPSNHSGPSPTHHHHRRHSSSTSNPDLPNATTPTGPPLYLAPVIVTEFHQHQHNHNHTHEHKLNITTKDERQLSPRSQTPLSNEPKKPKTGFSVNDMFTEKAAPISKHSPQSQSQGFLSVISNKKESSLPASVPLKKPSNGKWSTAHVHIAWMIYHHEQRQREKLNLTPTNKIRPSPTQPFLPPPPSSAQSALLPPPLPLIENNDLSLLRPPIPPPPLFSSFPFDMTNPQNHLFRPGSTAKLPRPTVTPAIKTPTVKREQKTPLFDERMRHTSPSPLSRSTSGSNFLPSSPSQRMRMDYPSLLLAPPQHHMPSFALNDDRKRFMSSNADFLPPFGPTPPATSPFLSSLFPMGAPPIPPPPPIPSSSSRRSGINSDSPKSSLFPPPPSSTPFDFTRSPLMPPPTGLSLANHHLESDRYRFLLEQQARERDFQFALMAASSGGGPPPPSPFFPDPNASALFKHF